MYSILGEEGDVLDETLVEAHLVGVPGLGTLTARGLTGGDLQVLGGEADGALDAQVLGLGALEELSADLLDGGTLAGSEGDALLKIRVSKTAPSRCPCRALSQLGGIKRLLSG